MLLEELSQAFGVSGYEKEVREIIKREVAAYADELLEDALGNLIVLKRGKAAGRKKIMLAAHMDEVGIQVKKIEENGHIKFKTQGFLWFTTTLMSRVRFRNGVVGIVAGQPEDAKGDFNSLYIDIGAKSKEEAMKYIKIGDVASYIGEFIELKDNKVAAKALDDRAGCYIMIEAMKQMKEPLHDVYFVFTVQEELGCRGSKVTAERIKPDLGIAVDVTPAHDYPCDLEGSNALGAGVAIKVSDPSVVCDEYIVEEMVKCCEENRIKWQYEVIDRGGTDSGSISLSNYGVKTGGITFATRHPHGPNSMVSMSDIEAAIALLSKFLEREISL